MWLPGRACVIFAQPSACKRKGPVVSYIHVLTFTYFLRGTIRPVGNTANQQAGNQYRQVNRFQPQERAVSPKNNPAVR